MQDRARSLSERSTEDFPVPLRASHTNADHATIRPVKTIDHSRWRHGSCGLARKRHQRSRLRPDDLDSRHGGNVNRCHDEPHNANGRAGFVIANPASDARLLGGFG
jgi:hypothetical protein